MSKNSGVKKVNRDVSWGVRKGNTINFKDRNIVKTNFIYRDDTKAVKIQNIDLSKIKTSLRKLYIYKKKHI